MGVPLEVPLEVPVGVERIPSSVMPSEFETTVIHKLYKYVDTFQLANGDLVTRHLNWEHIDCRLDLFRIILDIERLLASPAYAHVVQTPEFEEAWEKLLGHHTKMVHLSQHHLGILTEKDVLAYLESINMVTEAIHLFTFLS
jgi:hypothetical protein